ncbi:hypothetical protein C6502_09090 [Candidatus Poribacteria bacterium]|nr:MAG: hypothetical protein C6502_09090 [Candidatus Poribacteria bacterium]
MAFAEKASQYILKHMTRLGIGCGIWMILMGVYILIIASNAGKGHILHPGMGCVLLGISFITMNLLEWKPLLMLTCTVVALGLAMWILVFKPGDDPAERAALVQQEVVKEASKPDEALDAPASSTR